MIWIYFLKAKKIKGLGRFRKWREVVEKRQEMKESLIEEESFFTISLTIMNLWNEFKGNRVHFILHNGIK